MHIMFHPCHIQIFECDTSGTILKIDTGGTFIQAILLYGLFLFSQRITFRPFKIDLQKKNFKKFIPYGTRR